MSVRMIHPDLPDQPITVYDPRAIEIHERSGWRLENAKDRPGPDTQLAAVAGVPEGQVLIFHPASGQETVVPESSVDILRASGWLKKAEHEENQRQAEAAASKAKASKAAASKEE